MELDTWKSRMLQNSECGLLNFKFDNGLALKMVPSFWNFKIVFKIVSFHFRPVSREVRTILHYLLRSYNSSGVCL